MKFDVVVGNPPYQDSYIGENNQALPLYNYFYELAEKTSDIYCLISPARFLANQGGTPTLWNKKMLEDNFLKIVYYNPNSNDVFSGVSFKGGIVSILRNTNKYYGKIGIFIPYEELRSIFQKINLNEDNVLSNLVYSPDSYKFSELMFEENPVLIERTDKAHQKAVSSNVFSRYPEVFYDENIELKFNTIKLIGREEGVRKNKLIDARYLKNHENLYKWKVILAGANGKGLFGETLSSPFVAEPGVAHNQTFVSIGNFSSEFEADSLLKYIKSKFFRCLLGIMKTTQNNQSKNTWSKIPVQNFTENSDIDWTKSISEIDQQLYKKYRLDENEITFIEEKVRAME